MKVAILAGGRGTRLAEETDVRPKPMVEIGGRPILWHIMKCYERFGFDDFTIALGYKGEYIKRWMVEHSSLTDDLTVHFRNGRIERHGPKSTEWDVSLIDTGLDTLTGGRLKRLRGHLGSGTFMLTYGDGLCDVDLANLLRFHRSHGKLATLTAVRPPARFGMLDLSGDSVSEFSEKPQMSEGWINGGFFVLEPQVLDYIEGDAASWESGPLTMLARDNELMAYRHDGFWQCMDTVRDKLLLEDLWATGNAPWERKGMTNLESAAYGKQRLHRSGHGAAVAVGGA
jgi:glucose-1-phosphate cytidylyltransferase